MDPIPQIPVSTNDAPRQFELDEMQNRVIDDLATSMRWSMVPLYLVGLVSFIAMAVQLILVQRNPANRDQLWMAALALILGIVFIILARWLGKAASAFDRVTHTTQWDITHLMNGLQQLRKFFGVFRLFVQVLLLVGIITVVLLLITRMGQQQVV